MNLSNSNRLNYDCGNIPLAYFGKGEFQLNEIMFEFVLVLFPVLWYNTG
jgi:hypothetical protein